MSSAAARTRLSWQPCERCGALGVDAQRDGATVLLACPNCGHEERRRRMPFFSVTGASCSGKSTLVRRLWRLLPECVTFDGDVLWRDDFWNDREAFYARWLAVAAQASQSGHPVIVCTAAMPDDWNHDFAVLVGDVHMIAIVCDDRDLHARFAARQRPVAAEAPDDFVDQTVNFNRWLRDRVEHVDSSALGPDAVSERVAGWIRERL